MRLSIAIVALSLVGCASRRVPDHTLLYTPDRQHHIWSYQAVDGEGFVSRPLRAGERVVLKSGAVVSFDGKAVAVDSKQVDALNAVIDADGQLREGAFIRTFD